MATVHVAATCENLNFLETMVSDVPWRGEIFREPIVFQNGSFLVPQTVGLGVEVDEKLLDAYPFSKKAIRHYKGDLTCIRPVHSVAWYS